jgi:hypothetical protein
MMAEGDTQSLTRYLGSSASAVGLLLFFLGAGGLLVSVLAMTMGFSLHTEGEVWLLVPGWSVIAVPLGLAMRRGARSTILLIAGWGWLAPALAILFISKNFG